MEELVPWTRADLVADDVSDRAIARAIDRGSLTRVRHGFYAASARWRETYPEQRERALASAARDAARIPPIFGFSTAAAIHGLPLWRHTPDRAHVMARSTRSGAATGAVVRHRCAWDGEIEQVDGFNVTTLARTVFDFARTATRAAALSAADAALRRAAMRDGSRSRDLDAAEALRAEICRLVVDHAGGPGVRRARFAADHADARADSVGESLSRLHLLDLGIRDVELQVGITIAGVTYEVDFAIDGVLGEFDGAQKYLDRTMQRGRTPEQVLADEKRREDAIRAATGRRLIRWTMHEASSRARFAAFLRDHGIHPRRPVRSPRT